ncbi:MAG: class I SAM-dependent methyltransferase [Gemmatimonadota bacterium]|nr:class I SAM-dependent methyltransferase [Gemmatimonadota bacterium]
MEREEYDRSYTLERGHWWFRGKREAVRALLRRIGTSCPSPGEVVLDVGCGTGGALEVLGPPGFAVGIDDHEEALLLARRRGRIRPVRATAVALPVASGSVDRLFLLDVLEHVPDDRSALCEVRRALRPGGTAVVHVPAHPSLWSPHDEVMHHVRRYRRSELVEKLVEAGLEPVVVTYTFAGILLPATVVRWWKRRSGGEIRADFGLVPRWANHALLGWQRCEAALLRRVSLPFGLSLAAVARPDGAS